MTESQAILEIKKKKCFIYIKKTRNIQIFFIKCKFDCGGTTDLFNKTTPSFQRFKFLQNNINLNYYTQTFYHFLDDVMKTYLQRGLIVFNLICIQICRRAIKISQIFSWHVNNLPSLLNHVASPGLTRLYSYDLFNDGDSADICWLQGLNKELETVKFERKRVTLLQ